MTLDRRDFLIRYGDAWAERAAVRRASGSALDIAIAGALERIVAGMRAELAALPAPVPQIPTDDGAITWRSPVFNVGGRFNPFAGTQAEQMLATAATIEALGYPDLAAQYRERAAADPEILHVRPPAAQPVKAAVTRRRSRPIWSGPNLPPPDPVPFVAGPQMELLV